MNLVNKQIKSQHPASIQVAQDSFAFIASEPKYIKGGFIE